MYAETVLGRDDDGNAGVVAVSMWEVHMVQVLCLLLEFAVVRGVRGVCEMFMCLARGMRCGGERVGLGCINHVGTGGVCVCAWAAVVWGVGVGLGGWGGVMSVCCTLSISIS